MTQDFAKKPRRKAPRAPQKKPKPKSQVPAWVWLFTGTMVGAFVMFLTYLGGLPSSESTAITATNAPVKVASATPPSARQDSAIPKPRFDFYQLLEEDQVETPRNDHKPTGNAAVSSAEAIEYLMQVGSFKRPADADRLRAELLMMNLEVSIEPFKKRNNDRYYRVLVGPYPNRAKMSKDRSTLTDNKIDIWVITRKTNI